MPTTVITNLDALTGPTSTGTLTNASDSAPDTMGCNVTGSDGSSGSMISSQTKLARSGAILDNLICAMTVDFDGTIVQIPADAQIYKVEISAQVGYSATGRAQYTRTAGSGNVDGQSSVSCLVALTGGGTYTPTTATIINDGDALSDTITITAFDLNTIISNGFASVLREFVFEPAGSNPEAPLGYITRAQLVAQFTNQSILMDIASSNSVQTAVNNGTYNVNATASLQCSLWIMRVFWNPGAVVTDIQPNPATDNDTITFTGTGLDSIPDIDVHYTNSGGPQVVACTILTQTPTLLTLSLPNLGNFMGTVTFFTGSVSLGTLTIYVATGSGIYRIVANKRNDTLYDRATGATTDTAIPEPFGETGFIGG